MAKYDIIIIGAGISGLSLAHYCSKKGLKTLVIEKSERTGGTLHSHAFENTDGFWLELGAHTCYNSYRNLIGVMEDCGILNRLVSREKVPFKMLIGSRIKSIPSQLNFPELLLSAPRIFTLKKEGQSIESYYSKIVGSKNFAQVIGPAMNAVISQKADGFPADMLFKKRLRRKDIIKKFTLNNGVQTITDSISSQKNIEIIKGQEVISIKTASGIFHVATRSSAYESDNLALATPASAAARLLQEPFPELSEELSKIKVEPVESVGVAVKKDMVSVDAVAGLIPASGSFHSVVSRDTVKHAEYRGFTFHFKPGIMNHDAKLKQIAQVLGIKQDQIKGIATKENFVPSLKVGHNALVDAIDRMLSGKRLFLAGNYFDGMAIEDCVTRSLNEFLRLEKLSAQ